jgi:hypothetical protein
VLGVPYPGRHWLHDFGGPGTHVLQFGIVQAAGVGAALIGGAPETGGAALTGAPAVPVTGAAVMGGPAVPVMGAAVVGGPEGCEPVAIVVVGTQVLDSFTKVNPP